MSLIWRPVSRARLSGISLVYGVALLAVGCILVSLVGNILASFADGAELFAFTTANYLGLLFDEDGFGGTLLRTLLQGAGTIAVMLPAAVLLSWLLARTDFPGKKLVEALLTAQVALPGFISAMAYVWLLNPNNGLLNRMISGIAPTANIYSIKWICILQGVALVPAATFMLLPAFRNLDGTLEEAALASGLSRWRTLCGVILPLLAPAILACALFFFVIAIEVFDFVALIGIPGHVEVLSLWIYDAVHPVQGLPDYGLAGALGMVMFAIAGVAIAAYARLMRTSQRFAVLRGKARTVQPMALGGWKYFAFAFVAAWFAVALVIPLLTLIWVSLVPYLQPPSAAALRSVTLKSYGFAWSYMAVPLRNTLAVIVVATLVSLSGAIAISWVVTRSGTRLGRWIDRVVFISPAVPSMVAAVAFQTAAMILQPIVPLYGSVWLIAIALGSRMLAFCTRTLNAAGWQLHPELDEAAYASGLSRFATFNRLFVPLLAPALLYAGTMVCMLSARELTLPLMIDTGQAPVVAKLIYDLQTNGDFATSSAIAIYVIIVLFLVVALGRRFSDLARMRQFRLLRVLRWQEMPPAAGLVE
jgi:iron(III) transport system permease protein